MEFGSSLDSKALWLKEEVEKGIDRNLPPHLPFPSNSSKYYFNASKDYSCGHHPRMGTIIHLSAAPNPSVGTLILNLSLTIGKIFVPEMRQ